MQQLSNGTHDYLLVGIPSIAIAILFLIWFYMAIKSQRPNKLNRLTGVLSATILAITLLRYIHIDITEVLPLKTERILPGMNAFPLISLIFLTLLIFSFGKYAKEAVQACWILLLIANSLDFCLITYEYLTWTKETAVIKEKATIEHILNRSFEYTFSRYLFKAAYPASWMILSLTAVKKIRTLRT